MSELDHEEQNAAILACNYNHENDNMCSSLLRKNWQKKIALELL